MRSGSSSQMSMSSMCGRHTRSNTDEIDSHHVQRYLFVRAAGQGESTGRANVVCSLGHLYACDAKERLDAVAQTGRRALRERYHLAVVCDSRRLGGYARGERQIDAHMVSSMKKVMSSTTTAT